MVTYHLEDGVSLVEEAAALVTSSTLAGVVPVTNNPNAHVMVLKEPLGVILGIAPWNAPLILGLRAVVAAIAAGNTAILKVRSLP
jgi:acyl-CoA reductase-like NAD-dependent aldehyde dehydrogenase